MYKLDDIINYRCPRWEELPDIELYMDQVVSVIEKSLEIFRESEDYKTITPTMISNYVKHKIMKPPVNKKYERTHLAYLYIVCVLKRFLALSEIRDGMDMLLKFYPVNEAYNLFCDELEASIRRTFLREDADPPAYDGDHQKVISVIRAVTSAFANIFYARCLISARTHSAAPEKVRPSKKEKNKIDD